MRLIPRGQIRFTLVINMDRLVKLFREWDEDGSGEISRVEFDKAVKMLGFTASAADVRAVFDSIDADKSGSISYEELDDNVHRSMELQPSLLDKPIDDEQRAMELELDEEQAAAGEIELGIDQRYAVRKGKLNKDDSVLLQGLDLQENGKPIAEQVTCAVGVVRCGLCARGLCLFVVCGVGCIGAGHGGVCVRDLRGGGGVCRRSPMPLRRTWCA